MIILEPIRSRLPVSNTPFGRCFITPMSNFKWSESTPYGGMRVHDKKLTFLTDITSFQINISAGIAKIRIGVKNPPPFQDLSGFVQINGSAYLFGASLRETSHYDKNKIIIGTKWVKSKSSFNWEDGMIVGSHRIEPCDIFSFLNEYVC